jgi:hypothetical protein
MATLQSLVIDDTGFLQLPTGTTAERPASPVAGYTRINTSFTPPQLELWNGSAWRDYKNRFTAGLGLASESPASNAVEILDYNPQAADGLYWINVSGTARQIWCDMKNGGWMFAGRMTSDSTFGYDSALWTDGNVLNSTSAPTVAQNIKTYAWFLPINKARMSLGFIHNYLEENWYSTNGLVGIFSTPAVNTNINWNASRGSQFGRQKFIEWFNRSINVSGTAAGAYGGRAYQNGNGASWDNCNMGGVNMQGNSGTWRHRYGIQLNNEGECASSDYGWGLGIVGQLGTVGAGKKANYNAGPYVWNTGDNGWIFVQ